MVVWRQRSISNLNCPQTSAVQVAPIPTISHCFTPILAMSEQVKEVVVIGAGNPRFFGIIALRVDLLIV